MTLPPELRSSFREAYRTAFGEAPNVEDADRIALALLEALGVALTIIATRGGSRRDAPVGHLDGPRNKRDHGRNNNAI